MTLYINLRWSSYRVQHIALHDITPEEVEEAIFHDRHRIFKKYQKSTQFPGKYLYLVYGQTSAGRLITIILLNVEGNVYIPLTARNVVPSEKQQYFRKGK